MERGSTKTSSNDCHPLPHQQFSSRIAFANNSNAISKVRLNSLSNKKSTRLPPLTRYDSIYSPPNTGEQSIRYFNRSADSNHSFEGIEIKRSLDPNLRVKQLEQNIKFVREDCQHLLQSLHQELEDLKIKNRDLQFQLISDGSFSPQLTQSLSRESLVLMPLIRGALEPQIGEYINRLENEVKRLRLALGETHKTNCFLKQELKKVRDNKQTTEQSNQESLTSPPIGDFDKTFEEINKMNKIQNTYNLPRIPNSISK